MTDTRASAAPLIDALVDHLTGTHSETPAALFFKAQNERIYRGGDPAGAFRDLATELRRLADIADGVATLMPRGEARP